MSQFDVNRTPVVHSPGPGGRLGPNRDAPGVPGAPGSQWATGENEWLTLALEASVTSIWDFDVVANSVTLDANWSRMLGGPSEVTVASMRRLFSLLHPDDQGRAFQATMDNLKGKSAHYLEEYRIRNRLGDWIWIQSKGKVISRDATGRAIRMIGTNTDVTPRKNAELAGSRQAEFLAALNQTTLSLLQRRAKSEILDELTSRVAVLLDATQVEVALVEGDVLVTYAGGGMVVAPPGSRSPRGTAPMSWQAVDGRQPVIVADYHKLPNRSAVFDEVRFYAAAVFPIVLDSECLGVLNVLRTVPGQVFSAEEQQKGVLLAQLAALVLHNAEIYEAARREADERTAALQESERLYRTLVENVSQGNFVADARSCFTYCNPGLCAMGGYTPEELRGTTSFRLVAPSDRPAVIRKYIQWSKDPAVAETTCEFKVRTKSGREFWVEQTTHFLREENGRMREFHNVLRDISERKAAEVTLREGEARFRAVFDQSPVGIGLLTIPDGRIVELNTAIIAMSGYAKNEIVGKTAEELKLWVDPGRRLQYLERLRADGVVRDFEAEMRAKGGEIYTVLYSGCLVTIGGRPFSINTLLDITARKRAEQLFRDLFAFSSDACLIASLQGDILDVNEQALRLFGYTREEVVGQSWATLVPAESRQAFQERLDRYFANPIPHPMGTSAPGLVARSKDGRVFPIDIGLSPLQSGGESRIVAAVRDITVQKQAELALRQSEDQLRQAQKMESLGTLAGGIAHDFNNILTGILGHTQLALYDLPAGHPSHPWLQGVLQSGARAKNLVQQILTFSRKAETTRAPVRVQVVAREAFTLLRSTLPAMVRLEQQIDDDCPPVLADASQIHQVILNLCTNAWQALPEQGGRIDLRLVVGASPDLGGAGDQLAGPGRGVILSVIDNGMGMDAATIARVFEPFFTTKEVGKGTGLGLAVVHSIVGAHGGTIAVSSKPGEGTRFDVTFPVINRAVPPRTAAPMANMPRGHGESVLVVDDEPTIGKVVAMLLERLGYQTKYCPDPEQALTELVAGRYAMLVTDLAMPNLSGAELARRALGRLPDLPVLMLTGFIEPAAIAALRSAGVREILGKPPDVAELAAAMARCLRK